MLREQQPWYVFVVVEWAEILNLTEEGFEPKPWNVTAAVAALDSENGQRSF